MFHFLFCLYHNLRWNYFKQFSQEYPEWQKKKILTFYNPTGWLWALHQFYSFKDGIISSVLCCTLPLAFFKGQAKQKSISLSYFPMPSSKHITLWTSSQTNKQNQTQYTQIQQSGFGSLLRSQIPLFNCPTKFGWVKCWCSKKPFWYYLKEEEDGKGNYMS